MRSPACIAVVLCSAGALAFQDPQRPPTFKTGLELVRVDVSVVDGNGKPVTTLTADDFILEEDGVPQKIQLFKAVELTGHPAPGDETSLAVTSRGHAATELARDDVRVFLVFWDDYHIPQLPGAVLLRDALKGFLREMLGPTDMVAVMTQWTPVSALEFTRDHERLAFDIRHLEGRAGNYMPRNVAEENHLRHQRNIARLRAEVSLSALRSAMMHLGAGREGRKAILYFSREFGLGRDTHAELGELIRTANDANVAFYSINPDGLRVGRARYGLLSDLALNTGGEALSTNALTQALERAVRQSSASYLLGYAPSPLRHDGKFHKISVKVRERRLQVRARSGYWAPDVAVKTRALKEAAVAATIPPAITKAFGELARLAMHDRDAPDRTVRTIVSPEPPNGTLAVEPPLLWRARRPADVEAVLSAAPPDATDDREFVRTDRLFVRFALAGESAAAADVAVRLLGHKGVRLTDLPLQRPRGEASWVVDFPLASIARGDYLIAIEATHGTAHAQAYVPIRVTGG